MQSILVFIEIVIIAFCVANFAHIMQYLCANGNEYGIPPLSKLHKRLAKYLFLKNKSILLKLLYCFKCQSVWYSAIAMVAYQYHNSNFLWCSLSIPLFTWFFANIFIKDGNFTPPYDP